MKKLRVIQMLCLVCLLLGRQADMAVAQVSGEIVALPFFHNIPASTFKAHNQSMDIISDKEGRIYVANFEGLVVWDGVEWSTIYSPRKSRFTSLMCDKDNRIWVGGLNLLGWVEDRHDGGINVRYVVSDSVESTRFGEVARFYEDQHGVGFVTTAGEVYHVDMSKGQLRVAHENRGVRPSNAVNRWGDVEVHERLVLPDGTTLMATVTCGVVALNRMREKIWQMDESTGLCSNSVVALCYDGKGTVWGATENGLFNFSTSKVYTHFTEQDGLKGQVNAALLSEDRLFVGTLQGLFVREAETFSRLPQITQSCQELVQTPDGKPLIAAAEGVFVYEDGVIRQLYSDHYALSLHVLDEESFLFGAADGIYKGYFDGRRAVMVDSIPYVYRFTEGKGDSLWITDTYRKTYWSEGGRTAFVAKDNKNISPLLDYTDAAGRHWKCLPSDMGLIDADSTLSVTQMEWLEALNSTSVQNIMVNGDVAWLGGAFGLIRLDLREAAKERPIMPKVYIRTHKQHGRSLSISVATDKTDFIGKTQYSYRLSLTDNWSPWGEDQELDFYNLSYGSHTIQVRAKTPYGNVVESDRMLIVLRPPFLESGYAIAMYIVLGLVLIYVLYRWRVNVMMKRQLKLEQIVSERTRDLREAQNALIRQEREATVGKLTKGLIDRILNPMNYVGNFSHLTRGLINDLRQDIEAERVAMSAESYEDAEDVLNMMDQNLEKIEQHGLSTTRILKAMEEVLKERSRERRETDLCVICQQDVDMLYNYYKTDIEKGHVQCEWKRPEMPVMANVNAEQISHVVTSMLGNAAYAIRRRFEMEKEAATPKKPNTYEPRLALILESMPDGHACIRVWDNGIGIEPAVMDKVFDPFFTTKPTAEASGLGLYLAQQIIQDHGGNITVTSEKYKYTEFTITL